MFHFISTIQIKFVKMNCVASDIKESLDLHLQSFTLSELTGDDTLISICGDWMPSSTNQLSINTKGIVIFNCPGS